MKPAILDAMAQQEVDRALAVSPNPGRFRTAIDSALADIAANPQRWPCIGKSEIRQFSFTRFPYSIIYFEESNLIRILAFAHHKRRPGYWKHRFGRRRP